jgi:hypothetical protein
MLKWIFIIGLTIIVSVLVYKMLLYSPVYNVESEKSSIDQDSIKSVNYIVTSEISVRITIKEIENFSSDKNFQFTQRNLKPALKREMLQKNI